MCSPSARHRVVELLRDGVGLPCACRCRPRRLRCRRPSASSPWSVDDLRARTSRSSRSVRRVVALTSCFCRRLRRVNADGISGVGLHDELGRLALALERQGVRLVAAGDRHLLRHHSSSFLAPLLGGADELLRASCRARRRSCRGPCRSAARIFLTIPTSLSGMPPRPANLARKAITTVSVLAIVCSTRLAAPSTWPAAIAAIESMNEATTAPIWLGLLDEERHRVVDRDDRLDHRPGRVEHAHELLDGGLDDLDLDHLGDLADQLVLELGELGLDLLPGGGRALGHQRDEDRRPSSPAPASTGSGMILSSLVRMFCHVSPSTDSTSLTISSRLNDLGM